MCNQGVAQQGIKNSTTMLNGWATPWLHIRRPLTLELEREASYTNGTAMLAAIMCQYI